VARILGPLRRETFRARLNADGRRHPVENMLTLTTLVLGVLAFVTGFIVAAHAIAAWAGVLGFVTGLYAQYISVTTTERSLIVVGLVGSFVGAALGIYHGGFFP